MYCAYTKLNIGTFTDMFLITFNYLSVFDYIKTSGPDSRNIKQDVDIASI